MGRLIVVANRLPVSVSKRGNEFHVQSSPGGLAGGLASLPDSIERLWMGWPGVDSEHLTPEDRERIRKDLAGRNCMPVFLSQSQIDQYYLGFCNETIWPLFHYFPGRTVFEPGFWKSYKQVNRIFCGELLKVARPGDSVWVHDFQLMLLPRMLRERMPELTVGYFLHIPWPSFELFRLLPWRAEILDGLLGADLIGFHSYDYVRHFLSSITRIAGLEQTLGEVKVQSRIVKVDAFPMGIDYRRYADAGDSESVTAAVDEVRRMVGNRRVILSVDRLDYTKGIVERLEAFDQFLSTYPDYRGAVVLIVVAVPSRTGIPDYQQLRDRLEQLVGRINGEYGAIGYMPTWYLYRNMPFEKLTALYIAADVAMVTPVRDGMNLIAKEFVAAKADGQGVLILSETTGAASELGEALIVNPYDKAAVVDAIKSALEMPPAEQQERNQGMQERLQRYDITRWGEDFLSALAAVKVRQQEMAVHKLSADIQETLCTEYGRSTRRLLLLDYDGTLVGFQRRPIEAKPDNEVLGLLEHLIVDEANTVAIVTGRDRKIIEQWLGQLAVILVAEHGGWIREKDGAWRSPRPPNEGWKRSIRPILELFSDRTPGAFVEEKDFSLVWHYRRAEPALAHVRMQELRDALVNLTETMDVGVFEGSKILEVRRLGISKGRAVDHLIAQNGWDFLLAAGDDYTDEEMFAVLPADAYSIKVGIGASRARFSVDAVRDMRSVLKRLLECHAVSLPA